MIVVTLYPLSPVLLAAVLFGVVWSITEKECLPGGNLFGITVLFICALIGGKLVALIRLPRLPPFPPLLGKCSGLSSYAAFGDIYQLNTSSYSVSNIFGEIPVTFFEQSDRLHRDSDKA